MTENLRGAVLMVVAMGLFAVEDALIKAMSDALASGFIIMLIGAGGFVIFGSWCLLRGMPIWTPEHFNQRVLARTGCEMFGTIFFVTALTLIPLTVVSAVVQATPLVVALGAAVFLGQKVGWRRWLAIFVGLAGVLMIIRPGMDGFQSATIFAVLGMIGLALRDLITRGLDTPIKGYQLTMQAYVGLVIAGGALMLAQGQSFAWPDAKNAAWLLLAVILSILAYLSIVSATRYGDAATVASFRYSRMLFALIIGYIAFDERADAMTLIGAVIVIAAGLFTLIREARLARAFQAQDPTV